MVQPRILIAEDDDLQGALLRTALEGRGYQADIVTDGLAAVRQLRTGRYDLALLDYHIPEVDGHAAAALLRDFFADADRPRLIAVTAAAKGLSERVGPTGGAAFDAIVSKEVGLPALLSVIDDNLNHRAARNIALQAELGRAFHREAAMIRRRRRWALLGAVPGCIMAGTFGVGLLWAASSLQDLDAAMGSARQTTALSGGATALLGAVQSAETSQRTYLATGTAGDRAAFDSDVRQVDRLLVSPTSRSLGKVEGAVAPQDIIEPRLRLLAQEAADRHAQPGAGGVPILSADAGRDMAEQLRAWANDLVSGSQLAVLAGLEALRTNIWLVLIVLLSGVLYALGHAGHAARRFWHDARPPAPRQAQPIFIDRPLLLQDSEHSPV